MGVCQWQCCAWIVIAFLAIARVCAGTQVSRSDMFVANLLIAARNLTRNRRRAMTALMTVSAAVIAMVLADGFAQWIFWAMREGTIQGQLGHIQVVRPGFHSAGAADPFAYVIPGNSPELPGHRSIRPASNWPRRG